MVRAVVATGMGLLLICAGGCTPAAETRALQVTLHKVEQERDELLRQCGSQGATLADLRQRTEAGERNWRTSQAELNNLRQRAAQLERVEQEYAALTAERRSRLLQRPTVPASPLPPATDDALQALAARLPKRVWYERGRGGLSFANDRLFESGSDRVRADAHASLHELAGILATLPAGDFEVVIVGHTDAAPITKPETLAAHPSNWYLSVHRAIAVKDVLVNAGLPASCIGVMGYAQHRPISGGHAQNRRIEVFIVRKGAVQSFEPVTPRG